jgi:hypothetical protein
MFPIVISCMEISPWEKDAHVDYESLKYRLKRFEGDPEAIDNQDYVNRPASIDMGTIGLRGVELLSNCLSAGDWNERLIPCFSTYYINRPPQLLIGTVNDAVIGEANKVYSKFVINQKVQNGTILSTGRLISTVHNHPQDGPPSIGDIMSLQTGNMKPVLELVYPHTPFYNFYSYAILRTKETQVLPEMPPTEFEKTARDLEKTIVKTLAKEVPSIKMNRYLELMVINLFCKSQKVGLYYNTTHAEQNFLRFDFDDDQLIEMMAEHLKQGE